MSVIPRGNAPRAAALVSRTAALLILLYQIRLLAADMADTPVFAAALAGALASAVFLYRKKIPPFKALIVLALVPWAVRFFIALPRWFIPGVSHNAIVLDSLLLDIDRNNFSALLPFYWTAITTYFCQRDRLFLRADIIAADTFFIVLFSIVPASSIEAYRWPVLMVALFAAVLFLQILSLILSAPPELKLRKTEKIFAGAFAFLLIALGGVFFIRPVQERAVDRGGGLLEPKLFRFDFSQFLRLESEIRVNDDLVLILKKDPEDYHILLRRYTLSGYSPKQGFFRDEHIDEAAHPQNLPNRNTVLPAAGTKKISVTDQEYYLVNFDASAFIGMNTPVEVTRFETWDASSFNSAYAVKSHTSEALPFELIEAVRSRPGPESLGLSPEEYALYTEYGGDGEIASFARAILEESAERFPAAGLPAEDFPEGEKNVTLSYWDQIQIIYDRLKFGEYRYSLKPGIAPDGDQLRHFLFTSKKGYCSYYAFAFTLMLRSLGIPCRVAAGFFADPSTEAFGYYPVRADMAHAWVEVWFPGYGWIEYDPTTEALAEGEEFRFSQGTPPELFERLMKEILDNRSRLKVKEDESGNTETDPRGAGRKTLEFIGQWGAFMVLALLVILFLTIRSGFLWLFLISGAPQKKTRRLWAHAKRRLALAGFKPANSAGEAEWAGDNDSANGGRFKCLYALYLGNAAARFAPVYTREDSRELAARYRIFSEEYRKAVPAGRRLLAWLLPPLALALRPSPGAGEKGGRHSGGVKAIGTILAVILLLSLRGETGAQDAPARETQNADTLYENAFAAQSAENWERAIELFGEGSKAYPGDPRFPWSLGNLYYSRRLFRLAWDELQKAEQIAPWEPSLLARLADTAAYLNMNEVSAGYLEKVLAFEPDNREAVGSLAWMYFKLHRLPEGERLLLDAIGRVGEDADFSMTLGTIYADMFRYREAKEAYLASIRAAEETGDRLFAALAHYNLSILETRFYQFALAYDRTGASLDAMNRTSGRLARGELLLARMELPRALAEYEEAYSMDNSPLSKLNLAQVFQTGGRLAEAARYAEDCLASGDESWMINYGIDPVRYKRDIHEILKDTYKGLFNAERFSCPASAKESLQSLGRKISYRFRAAVHTRLFRKYTLLAANDYGATGGAGNIAAAGEINPDALLQYYSAFEAYPRRARTYLVLARQFEEPRIPGSVPSYKFKEGGLFKNRDILEEAAETFDPVWERDMIAAAFAKLAMTGGKREREDASERLFAINRGAALQNGVRLPVELRVTGEVERYEGFLKKAADSAGLEPARLTSPRYTLTFGGGGEGYVSSELRDNGRGTTLWRQNLPLPAVNRQTGSQRAAFARALRDGIFNGF